MKILGIHAPDQTHRVRAVIEWSRRAPGRSHVAYPSADPVIAVSVDAGHENVSVAEDPDGSFAVVQGEMYNAAELATIAGRQRGTGLDQARIILDVWRRGSVQSLGDVNGHLAVSLWDASREQLTLTRDRSGIPPHFFAETDGGLVWASDIRSLLSLGLDAELDTIALDAYLVWGHVPAPWTFIKAVRKVPPAHSLTRDRNGTSVQQYWRPVQQPKLNMSESALVDELRDALEESLRRRVAHSGETGVLLSSGVDSSLLLAGLVKWIDAPAVAFTFDYEEYEGKWNEFEKAAELTQHLGIDHHRIALSPSWVANHLADLVRQYEEPFTYGLHTASVGNVKDMGISTLLCGALSGFPSHWEIESDELWALWLKNYAPSFLYRALSRMSIIPGRRRKVFKLAGKSIPDLYYEVKHTIIEDDVRRGIYEQSEIYSEGRAARLEQMETIMANGDSASSFDILSLLKNNLFAADHLLWWNDRWAQANGLSFRYPFHDADVLQLMSRIKYDDPSKRLLREVAATVMPREIAFRPKLPQTVPIRRWLRRPPLRDMVYEYLAPSALEDSGLFRSGTVQQIIDEHMNGEAFHEWSVLSLLCFMVWKEQFLDTDAVCRDSGVPPFSATDP